MSEGRDLEFKCTECGQYISYSDIGKDKTRSKFTPETDLTTEKLEMWHSKHERKQND